MPSIDKGPGLRRDDRHRFSIALAPIAIAAIAMLLSVGQLPVAAEPKQQLDPQAIRKTWFGDAERDARAHADPRAYRLIKLSQAREALGRGHADLRRAAELRTLLSREPTPDPERRERTIAGIEERARRRAEAHFRYALECLATLRAQPGTGFTAQDRTLFVETVRLHAISEFDSGNPRGARRAVLRYLAADLPVWAHEILSEGYRYESEILIRRNVPAVEVQRMQAESRAHLIRAAELRFGKTSPRTAEVRDGGRMPLERVVPPGLIDAHAQRQVWANESYARGLQADGSGFHEVLAFRARIGTTFGRAPQMTPGGLQDQRLTRSLAAGYFLLALDILEGQLQFGEIPETRVTISGEPFPRGRRFYEVVQGVRQSIVMNQDILGNYPEYVPHLRTYVGVKDPEGKVRPDREYPVYRYLARAYHYLETRERIRPSGPGKLTEYRAEKLRNIERGLRLFYKNDADFRFAWEALTGTPYEPP